MVLAVLLAHQGGWDEAVLVAVPLVVLVALLRMARRRALEEAELEEHGEGRGDPAAPAGPGPGQPPE